MTSHRVHNLLLLPEHMVCFCKQSHMEKWVCHSCWLRMSGSNTVSDSTVINLMVGLIDDWGGSPVWGPERGQTQNSVNDTWTILETD